MHYKGCLLFQFVFSLNSRRILEHLLFQTRSVMTFFLLKTESKNRWLRKSSSIGWKIHKYFLKSWGYNVTKFSIPLHCAVWMSCDQGFLIQDTVNFFFARVARFSRVFLGSRNYKFSIRLSLCSTIYCLHNKSVPCFTQCFCSVSCLQKIKVIV